MKKYLFLLLFFLVTSEISFAGSFSNQLPVPGKSQCDKRLQADVIGMLTEFTKYCADESCEKYQVLDTFTTRDFGVYKKPGTETTWRLWEEAWVIKACNRTFTMNVGFKNDVYGNTGTSFAITNAEELIKEAQQRKRK